jgi:hypothetical protein
MALLLALAIPALAGCATSMSTVYDDDVLPGVSPAARLSSLAPADWRRYCDWAEMTVGGPTLACADGTLLRNFDRMSCYPVEGDFALRTATLGDAVVCIQQMRDQCLEGVRDISTPECQRFQE